MTGDSIFPEAVFTLWRVTVVLALIAFVPLTVYMLHSLWRTARSIRTYSREALVAARGIQAGTAALPAANATIGVASELLSAAEAVAKKLDTVATVLEGRAGRRA